MHIFLSRASQYYSALRERRKVCAAVVAVFGFVRAYDVDVRAVVTGARRRVRAQLEPFKIKLPIKLGLHISRFAQPRMKILNFNVHPFYYLRGTLRSLYGRQKDESCRAARGEAREREDAGNYTVMNNAE